jgi:hypothetical protein
MNSKFKKELGQWGECALDSWMKEKKWLPFKQNLRIKGGEIDRIYYSFSYYRKEIRFCLAEVKTSIILKQEELDVLQTEIGLKRFLKARQIFNLYRYAEQLQSCFEYRAIQNKMKWKIFLRLFIVIKNVKKIETNWNNKVTAIKKCSQKKDYIIFSVEPEFTFANARKSLLQIKI